MKTAMDRERQSADKLSAATPPLQKSSYLRKTFRLTDKSKPYVAGCTFEKVISAIGGTPDIDDWKHWLEKRNIIK